MTNKMLFFPLGASLILSSLIYPIQVSGSGEFTKQDIASVKFDHYFSEHNYKKTVYYKIGSAYTINGITYHPKFNPHYKKVGVASWYGPGFQGRKTANGAKFDTNEITAASPDLPLFSKVWVTNLENGIKILVTVNDRGPYAKGRIIDLSNAAAKLLGYAHKGTTKVKVEYAPKETESFLKEVGLYEQYLKKTGQLQAYAMVK